MVRHVHLVLATRQSARFDVVSCTFYYIKLRFKHLRIYKVHLFFILKVLIIGYLENKYIVLANK